MLTGYEDEGGTRRERGTEARVRDAVADHGIRSYSIVFQKSSKKARIPNKIFFAPRIHTVGPTLSWTPHRSSGYRLPTRVACRRRLKLTSPHMSQAAVSGGEDRA